MKAEKTNYIKALRFNWLTKYYDTVVSLTTREKTFKNKLVASANLVDNDRVLDIGSGTGTLAILIKKSNPKTDITGIDGDLEIIKIAEKKPKKTIWTYLSKKDYPMNYHSMICNLTTASQAYFFITFPQKTNNKPLMKRLEC